MKAKYWSYVWGLLCMPAEVLLSVLTVKTNSSTNIKCSTSLTDPVGVYLVRGVHGNDVIYLSMTKGQINKKTTAVEFEGRIQIIPEAKITRGHGIILQLSLLRLEDTNLYYCIWIHNNSTGLVEEKDKGVIIIVKASDLYKHCKSYLWEFLFIFLIVATFAVMMALAFFIFTMFKRCTNFRRNFRPASVVGPSRPNRPQYICPQEEQPQHIPYLITSVNAPDYRAIF